MAGTTHRAELLAALAVLTLAPLGGNARAQAATVPDALVLSLAASDMTQLAQGLLDGPLAAPLEGRADVRVEQSFWFLTMGIDGIRYKARIADLSIEPRQGRLRARARLADLDVNIEKVFFNRAGTLFCRDMPIASGDGEVPVGVDMTPRAADRTLDLGAEEVRVGLTSRNYRPGQPASCHTFWGMNWLLRQTLPLAARLLRPVLEHELEKRLLAAAREVSGELGNYVTAEITLPFSQGSAPAFNGTFGVWPSTVNITPDALQLKLAAELSFDPDPPHVAPRRAGRAKAFDPFASELLPSWIGLKRSLFAALVAEANRAGLFRFTLSQGLLTVSDLARIIPDAATRFGPEQEVGLHLAGAAETSVIIKPDGPGGIPIIEAYLDGLEVVTKVDGEDYYSLRTSVRLTFQAGYSPSEEAVVLELLSLTARPQTGAFSPHLEPAPEDRRFDRVGFHDYVRTLEARLRDGDERILRLSLPDIAMGSRKLDFLGSSVRDDYLSLDATVVPDRGFVAPAVSR